MSMLRSSTARAIRTASFVRFNSTTSIKDWKEISFAELKPKTINPTPNAWLVDVRGSDEVKYGMIPGAVHIPVTKLSDSLTASPEEFKEQFGFSKPEKDDEITFYCLKGKRSTIASDMAKATGYTNVLNYKGSWIDWLENQAKPQ